MGGPEEPKDNEFNQFSETNRRQLMIEGASLFMYGTWLGAAAKETKEAQQRADALHAQRIKEYEDWKLEKDVAEEFPNPGSVYKEDFQHTSEAGTVAHYRPAAYADEGRITDQKIQESEYLPDSVRSWYTHKHPDVDRWEYMQQQLKSQKPETGSDNSTALVVGAIVLAYFFINGN